MMKNAATLSLAISVMTVAASTPAFAQTVVRGQGVADRARPDYDPYGYQVGAFTLYPAVTATAAATDNYFATDTNRRGDVYAVIAPELQLTSNWTRHRLNARVNFDQSLHASLSGQNRAQYGGALGGALDVSRATQITSDVSYGHYVESRADLGSFQGTQEPVTYNAFRARIGISQSFNRLVVGGSVALSSIDYNDTSTTTGLPIDQDFRDTRAFNASLSARYEVGAGISLVASGQYDKSTYSFRPGSAGFDPLVNIDRTSDGFNLQGGVSFELSSLVFGTIRFGVLNRDYVDPRLRDFRGFSYTADILWNVTPLTSLRLTGARSVEDTSSAIVAGNTRNTLRLAVDHELYRYIILSGNVGYGSFTPNGPGIGGDEFSIGGGARYLIDRRWSVSGNVGYAQRTSDSTFLRYRAASASVSVRFAL